MKGQRNGQQGIYIKFFYGTQKTVNQYVEGGRSMDLITAELRTPEATSMLKKSQFCFGEYC